MSRAALCFCTLCFCTLLLIAGPAAAQLHATFDTGGGNDWWVEVYVDSASPIVGVDARADGGDWVPLEEMEWGSWALSFFVPDGSLVEFRAWDELGDTALSGGYLWPSGMPVSTTDGPFEATFEHPRGNTWWIEVDVVAVGVLAAVEARIDGGEWLPLYPTEWGSFADSVYAAAGSVIEFRAHSTSGQEVRSGGYLWPDAVSIDGGDALPDLRVSPETLAAYQSTRWEYFPADSCNIAEQCVGGSGWRRLVRFATEIQNVGTGDVVFGDPQGNPNFEYHSCHQHFHLLGSTEYRVESLHGDVVAPGHKFSFCWVDSAPVPDYSPLPEPRFAPNGDYDYACNHNQGLTHGWADVYPAELDCQFVDITGVPAGDYVLSVTVNGNQALVESDYGNNEARVPLHIP